MEYEIRASNPHTTVGINLFNSAASTTPGTPAITFGIYGGEPDATNTPYTGSGWYHADASTGGVDTATPGTLPYDYQVPINIAITVTGPGIYSAIATDSTNTDAWTGTFTGSLLGFDIFNHAAGDGSDITFNKLSISTVVPEPGTIGLVSLGVMVLGHRLPRRARR